MASGMTGEERLDPYTPLSKSVAVFQINHFSHLNFEVSQLPLNKKNHLGLSLSNRHPTLLPEAYIKVN